MRRLLAGLVIVSALAQAPAFADPKISASMPAISASVLKGQLVVRMERGVLGTANSLKARSLIVVARDGAGQVVAETASPVSRRMTRASIPMTAAMQSASTVSVSIR